MPEQHEAPRPHGDPLEHEIVDPAKRERSRETPNERPAADHPTVEDDRRKERETGGR